MYFAIRRRTDGAFLPAGRSRGFTHDEPTAPDKAPPRLFVKKRAATAALKCWLQGEWSNVSRQSFEYDDADVWPEPPRTPPANRIPEDMEVVPVELTLVREGS